MKVGKHTSFIILITIQVDKRMVGQGNYKTNNLSDQVISWAPNQESMLSGLYLL